MRLVDADALKTDLTRFYDNEVTAKRLIDEQPTIPAIPVEWLVNLKNEYAREGREQAEGDLMNLLLMWRKKQEAQDV